MATFKPTERVFEIDKDLRLREELVSIHSMNSFIANMSSARSYMSSLHLSQSITLEHGEEKIIQTGLETQFANNTFSSKVDEDCRVVKVIERYRGVGADCVNKRTQLLVIVENIETNEYDYIDVPYKFSLHQNFGFKYRWNKDVLNRLSPGKYLDKGVKLADSPTVGPNEAYNFVVNANLALMTILETAEDGIVISRSLSEKFAFKMFETRSVEFGTKKFPLNTYGDKDNYKSFPEIGDMIGPDGVLMVLRDYDERLSPALTSVNDVRDFNMMFDHAVYVKAPGEILEVNNTEIKSGIIVDIKAYTNPKFKREVYTNTSQEVVKYVEGNKLFYKDIYDTYEEIQKEHYRQYQDNNVKISEKLHRLILDALAIHNPNNNKISYSFRNEPLDLYRLEFTIEYTVVPSEGYKITDFFGSKGIIVQVREDEDMPIDEFGNRADIVMDPASVTARMNGGRLYEQYINGLSRMIQKKMRDTCKNINNEKELKAAFKTLIDFLKIIDNEQFTGYSNVTDINLIKEIVTECLEKEVYIHYKISDEKTAYQIVLDAIQLGYELPIGPVKFVDNGRTVVTKKPVLIAPTSLILLDKTPDSFSTVASAKINHFGMPIVVNSATRNRMPLRASPVKIMSETEIRLYCAQGSRKTIIELKDRANSIKTHKHVYKRILTAPEPANIDLLVDRNVVPYGDDMAVILLNNIFNSMGFKLTYKSDPSIYHHQLAG